MKKYIKFKLLIFVAFLAIMAVSCDENNDPEPIVSTENYPVATFDISGTTANEEGGSVIFVTINTDKMLTRGISFSAEQIGGTATLHEDYDIVDVTIDPFTTEAVLQIEIHEDALFEGDETLEIQITTPSLANRYLLNPTTVLPSYSITIKNYYDPTLLSIVFAWDTDDDMDIVTMSDTATYPLTPWGTGGATGANPEVDQSIWLADPVGNYYVDLIDWDAGVTFNYTFTLGYPDGTGEVINGTWDPANAGNYFADTWLASWGSPNAYRLLKVVNDGTKFVVTAL